MRFYGITTVLLLLTLAFQGAAQKSSRKNGDTYFEAGKYREAIKSYQEYNKTEKEPATLIKRGRAYLYTNQPDACIADMAAAFKLKALDLRLFKYSAQAYFAKKEYGEAARFYKSYLNTLKRNDKDWDETVTQIRKCGLALNYKYTVPIAFTENLGNRVNTIYDEFGPVLSPTKPDRYYFSSSREGSTGGLRDANGIADVVRGHYSADMYLVDLKDGNWSNVLPFEQLLNSPRHDILQDFSQDGSILYYTKSNDLRTGTLYSDTFSIDRDPARLPVPAIMPFQAERGDRDLFIFSDTTILFAANITGGFGGYDIYYAAKKDSLWGEPVNLGPAINTAANEIAPFLIKNGKTLYFSSDRLESLGGYDIYCIKHDQKEGWKNLKNLGYPVSSPGNDTDIELSYDGMSAVFTSDRVESLGGKDLYMAYFKEQVTGQLEYAEIPSFLDTLRATIVNDSLTAFIPSAEEVKTEQPVKDYLCKPLYFLKDDDVLSNNNLNELKKASELMIVFPELNILLTSHLISEGRTELDLYFSLKRAEKVADQLIKSGISPHRIHLQGCGAGFPLASPFINGIPSSLAERTNFRIDVQFINTDTKKLRILYDQPVVASQFRDTVWDEFERKNKGLTFRVRFAKTSQMLKSDVLKWRPDIIIEKQANQEMFAYTMGNFQEYASAQLLRDEFLRNGFYEARIVPYLGGVEVENDKIPDLMPQWTELEKFYRAEYKKE